MYITFLFLIYFTTSTLLLYTLPLCLLSHTDSLIIYLYSNCVYVFTPDLEQNMCNCDLCYRVIVNYFCSYSLGCRRKKVPDSCVILFVFPIVKTQFTQGALHPFLGMFYKGRAVSNSYSTRDVWLRSEYPFWQLQLILEVQWVESNRQTNIQRQNYRSSHFLKEEAMSSSGDREMNQQ